MVKGDAVQSVMFGVSIVEHLVPWQRYILIAPFFFITFLLQAFFLKVYSFINILISATGNEVIRPRALIRRSSMYLELLNYD